MNTKELAKRLDAAAKEARAIPQISLELPIDEAVAYEIQALSMQERYTRGDGFIGLKLGFTSYAKMEQMGVHDMIWGRLTQEMLYRPGSELPMDRFIHPRAEPELCFLVKKTMDREIGMHEIPEYIGGVAPAIEIIDSRYENFKFSLEDVIADNCSSSAFVVGAWQNINQDLGDLQMELVINGEVRESGSSEAILGDPLLSITNASRLAEKYGQVVPAGSYLMAGAATSAVFLEPGQEVSARVRGLGSVTLKTV